MPFAAGGNHALRGKKEDWKKQEMLQHSDRHD